MNFVSLKLRFGAIVLLFTMVFNYIVIYGTGSTNEKEYCKVNFAEDSFQGSFYEENKIPFELKIDDSVKDIVLQAISDDKNLIPENNKNLSVTTDRTYEKTNPLKIKNAKGIVSGFIYINVSESYIKDNKTGSSKISLITKNEQNETCQSNISVLFAKRSISYSTSQKQSSSESINSEKAKYVSVGDVGNSKCEDSSSEVSFTEATSSRAIGKVVRYDELFGIGALLYMILAVLLGLLLSFLLLMLFGFFGGNNDNKDIKSNETSHSIEKIYFQGSKNSSNLSSITHSTDKTTKKSAVTGVFAFVIAWFSTEAKTSSTNQKEQALQQQAPPPKPPMQQQICQQTTEQTTLTSQVMHQQLPKLLPIVQYNHISPLKPQHEMQNETTEKSTFTGLFAFVIGWFVTTPKTSDTIQQQTTSQPVAQQQQTPPPKPLSQQQVVQQTTAQTVQPATQSITQSTTQPTTQSTTQTTSQPVAQQQQTPPPPKPPSQQQVVQQTTEQTVQPATQSTTQPVAQQQQTPPPPQPPSQQQVVQQTTPQTVQPATQSTTQPDTQSTTQPDTQSTTQPVAQQQQTPPNPPSQQQAVEQTTTQTTEQQVDIDDGYSSCSEYDNDSYEEFAGWEFIEEVDCSDINNPAVYTSAYDSDLTSQINNECNTNVSSGSYSGNELVSENSNRSRHISFSSSENCQSSSLSGNVNGSFEAKTGTIGSRDIIGSQSETELNLTNTTTSSVGGFFGWGFGMVFSMLLGIISFLIGLLSILYYKITGERCS